MQNIASGDKKISSDLFCWGKETYFEVQTRLKSLYIFL